MTLLIALGLIVGGMLMGAALAILLPKKKSLSQRMMDAGYTRHRHIGIYKDTD